MQLLVQPILVVEVAVAPQVVVEQHDGEPLVEVE
jgi:hypothetical protein